MAAALTGLAAAHPAIAQVALDPDEVLTLSEMAWADRADFLAALDPAMGGLTLDMPRLPEGVRAEDPFLWSVTGSFGAAIDGVGTTGGIVACSRYGLATRDMLAERSLSDPDTFALFAATQAAPDDPDVWPEAAVARLACMITWNDTRRVAILPEEPARAVLDARFDHVSRSGDAEVLGEALDTAAPIYGEDGYLLRARGGRADSVIEVESARIELRVGHQLVRFRAFLMNGGM